MPGSTTLKLKGVVFECEKLKGGLMTKLAFCFVGHILSPAPTYNIPTIQCPFCRSGRHVFIDYDRRGLTHNQYQHLTKNSKKNPEKIWMFRSSARPAREID